MIEFRAINGLFPEHYSPLAAYDTDKRPTVLTGVYIYPEDQTPDELASLIKLSGNGLSVQWQTNLTPVKSLKEIEETLYDLDGSNNELRFSFSSIEKIRTRKFVESTVNNLKPYDPYSFFVKRVSDLVVFSEKKPRQERNIGIMSLSGNANHADVLETLFQKTAKPSIADLGPGLATLLRDVVQISKH